MRKNVIPLVLSFQLLFSTCGLCACNQSSNNPFQAAESVLRVASWDEYIDEGGEDSYAEGSKALYEEFEDWYFQITGKKISVEYITLQDNETMYNKIKMGDHYDLLCPSEYMMMKLAEENRLEKLPDSFFNTENPNNYYVNNLSPYIKSVFDNGKLQDGSAWSQYVAGYMWGSTGFVFNPEKIARNVMTSWSALLSKECKRKITAKDNVRDSYFMGLGMHYEQELLALKQDYESGKVSRETYKSALNSKMNDTSETTMNAVKKQLEAMRSNLYGLETDEGKLDVATGRLDASYQWSGDAVYILDVAEESDLYLEYSIPSAASNLWFDGWVMMKGANIDAATAFINFLSMPENAIRNMYYIGYTSCIGGAQVFDYVTETYGAEEGDNGCTSYDLSYFFGENHILNTTIEQTRRQLYAQYPDQNTIDRLVVMNYFDKKTNERANRMWNNIK